MAHRSVKSTIARNAIAAADEIGRAVHFVMETNGDGDVIGVAEANVMTHAETYALKREQKEARKLNMKSGAVIN